MFYTIFYTIHTLFWNVKKIVKGRLQKIGTVGSVETNNLIKLLCGPSSSPSSPIYSVYTHESWANVWKIFSNFKWKIFWCRLVLWERCGVPGGNSPLFGMMTTNKAQMHQEQESNPGRLSDKRVCKRAFR